MVLKHLSFELQEKKPKTEVYAIISKNSGDKLGEIFWYPSWRRYVSETYEKVVIDSSCHKEISEFLDKLMEERK